jgi:hypothetical protein
MNGLEEIIETWLTTKNIYPFSVLYSKDPQFLKISLFLKNDVDELLDITGYKTMCDNSGVQIFPETNTILYTGVGLINFLRYVDN